MHLRSGRLKMAQKITIRLAGKEYILSADSPEDERRIRLAAEAVNARLSSYKASFPGHNDNELMPFVALNECIARLGAEDGKKALEDEAAKLLADTLSYLESKK